MARAYSQDLRDRVIDAGTSARAAAERFGIGVATAIVWTRRARETGERIARKRIGAVLVGSFGRNGRDQNACSFGPRSCFVELGCQSPA